MVRKTSLLGKLFGKKEDQKKEVLKTRSTTGAKPTVRPAAKPGQASGNGGGRPEVKAAMDSEIKTTPRVKPVPPPPPPKPVKKEDAQKAVVAGLNDLSSLLNGIQGQMENQGERTTELISKFEDLPETARAQISFLQKISEQMESQHTHTSQLLERFGQIPDLLAGVEKILASQQAAEERRDQTLGRFRETMDRINVGINTLSKDNSQAMQETAKTIEKSQVDTTRSFEKTQRQTLEAFQKSQESQSKAIAEIMAGSAKQGRMIAILISVAVLAMTAVFITVLAGGLN